MVVVGGRVFLSIEDLFEGIMGSVVWFKRWRLTKVKFIHLFFFFK